MCTLPGNLDGRTGRVWSRLAVCNDLYDSYDFIGFSHTDFPTHYPFAGITISNNVILSARPNHIHEIIHPFVSRRYPSSPMLIQEGIATYYGGCAGISYEK